MKHVSNKECCILVAAALATAFGNAPELLAQGCAMCKTVAAAQSRQAAASWNLGILWLLIPPVAIMSSLLLFAFRFRNAPGPTEEAEASAGNEDVASTAA